MRLTRLFGILVVLSLGLITQLYFANAQSYGINLIVNPGGDVIDAQGTTRVSTSHYFDVTDTATMFGWTLVPPADPNLHNAPTTYRYDSDPATEDYPLSRDGPEDENGNFIGGLNFFFGGFNGDFTGVSAAYQDINLAAFAADLNAGIVKFTLSGFLGGYYTQSDSVTISAIFRDANGAELGRGSIGPMTVAERDNGTRNSVDYKRTNSGAVPTGTRSVRVQMDWTGGGRSLDGYADNLSLVLTILGDVNRNGCVEDVDLTLVLRNFGSLEPDPPGADLNGDGQVNNADIAGVLSTFGRGC